MIITRRPTPVIYDIFTKDSEKVAEVKFKKNENFGWICKVFEESENHCPEAVYPLIVVSKPSKDNAIKAINQYVERKKEINSQRKVLNR